jgi:SET family sugar efflux transporter-like MFS transporter
MLLQVLYFALVGLTSAMAVLVAAQVARGVAVAVVGALGIAYFQDLLLRAVGRATTLFANTSTAGSLASGVLAGAAAQLLGYRAALLMCGVFSVLAWLLLEIARRTHRERARKKVSAA